jgi:hypothetical protein
MTTEWKYVIVFRDQAGEHYLLPQEALERGRVSAERGAEVERLVSEAEGDDVTGHILRTVGVLTMPTLAAVLVETAADSKLIRWIEQEVISGGPA